MLCKNVEVIVLEIVLRGGSVFLVWRGGGGTTMERAEGSGFMSTISILQVKYAAYQTKELVWMTNEMRCIPWVGKEEALP